MNTQDLARVARQAPHLRQLVVVSLPDSLVLGHWSSAGADNHVEDLAAQLGILVGAARAAGRSSQLQSEVGQTLIEADGQSIIAAGLGADAAVGLVFDGQVTLGLARVQARQIGAELEPLLQEVLHPQSKTEDRVAPPPPRPPLERSSPRAEAPRPTPPAPPPRPVAPRPSPVPAPAASTRPAPAPAVSTRPAPAPAVSTRPASPVTAEVAVPSQVAAATDTESSDKPRAVRLLDFLHRYAPDPHVTMLRLSLRTGISLDALSTPEHLDEAQVENLAASVRDIIGQEQLGI